MHADVREIPYIGEHTQISLECDSCGWRQTDFIPPDASDPVCITLQIATPDHLTARVVRGSSSTIQIPELDLEVLPGSHNPGTITNVEGLLSRFLDTVHILKRDLEGGHRDSDIKVLSHIEDRLQEIISLERSTSDPLKIELLDPTGHSSIAHPDAIQRALTDAEIELLVQAIRIDLSKYTS